jgi:hypothetical protein
MGDKEIEQRLTVIRMNGWNIWNHWNDWNGCEP